MKHIKLFEEHLKDKDVYGMRINGKITFNKEAVKRELAKQKKQRTKPSKEELKDRFWEFVTQLSDKELLKLYKKTDNTESEEYEIQLELGKRGLIN